MWEVIIVCNHLNQKWEKEGKVRRITLDDVLQFYGVKNYKASGGSYFCVSATRLRFFDLNLAGRTWNDKIVWVKGNCLQRDDEEPLGLRFRTVKQSVKSKVERKESMLDEVMEEETELELVLEGLSLSRKKKVSHLVKGIWLVEGFSCRDDWSATVETKANLDKMVDKYDRLWHYLILKGYSEWEVDAIKADTYDVEEYEEEAETAIREMSLRIKDLESGLARERETSKALLSAQAELQVELDSSRSREDDTLMCNWEKVLEGEIKVKESLVMRKEELLKDIPAREELKAEILRLRARVVDLEAMYLAESAKYTKFLVENVIYHAKVDAEMTE
ncbi:hypothetical protein GIB67_021236 [Kingdonia uniflora]|uniref:Uncharacterized protein n=1 Tax=Kingdonia uniflora TaxID=39325 RepID=A0A7J7LFV6_9MAGN|nr:hypothetical protein GIB67_021236 [Kingdonia uniflora]